MNQATFRENRTVAFFHTILHMTAMSFAKSITPGGALNTHRPITLTGRKKEEYG
jgi:hypothetical protein